MEVTSQQLCRRLLELSEASIADTPEFVFMIAAKEQLIGNGFEEAEVQLMLNAQTFGLPADATPEQLKEMGKLYAEVLTRCYNGLMDSGNYDDPIIEAGTLANRLALRDPT